jgi:hypothetical protein
VILPKERDGEGAGGSGGEGETDTTRNMNSGRDHCVFMSLYETTLQCGQLRQNVTSPQNNTCIWNAAKLCTFFTASVQTGVHLVRTCEFCPVC